MLKNLYNNIFSVYVLKKFLTEVIYLFILLWFGSSLRSRVTS